MKQTQSSFSTVCSSRYRAGYEYELETISRPRALSIVSGFILLIIAFHAESSYMKDIILETDITFDVDDVGALGVLHVLADHEKARILAIMYNEVHVDGIRAIHAINEWYNRPNLPIGRFKGELRRPDSSRYLSAIASMYSSSKSEREALNVYREILSKQAEQSTTIVSVGFLNNLQILLREERELVKRTIKELVVMGGRHRDNFNFVRHDLLATTKHVLRNWPTPVAVTDFGHNVRTGTRLQSTDPRNPVREAYFRWFNGSFQGRSSWDQIAVLYGVGGEGNLFTRNSDGKITFRDDDELALEDGVRYVINPTREKEYYQNLIEELMVALPKP